MKLDTPFVEYLIIGMHTSTWLVLLSLWAFDVPIQKVLSINPGLVVILLPFVYLLGMVFDSIVYPMLNPYRKKIKKSVISDKNYKDELLAHYSPNLYAAYETRVRRVRIIGAGIFNWVLVGISMLFHTELSISSHVIYVITVTVTLSAMCIFVWSNLYKRAYAFRKNAIDIITADKEIS